MTSVQSRPQLLNGSKILLFLICVLVFFSSCGLFTKKAPERTPTRKVPPREVEVIKDKEKDKKLDEDVIIGDIFEDEKSKDDKKLTEAEKEKLEKEKLELLAKKSYEISILIPAKSALVKYSTEAIPDEQKRLINFYIGVQMAVDSLKKLGLNFKVNSFDVENPSTTISNLLNTKKLANSAAIIGLTKSEHFLELSSNENLKNTWLVSPWNNNYNLAQKHNNLVFMRSGTDAFARSMFAYAKKNYKSSEVVIVHTNSPREKTFLESFEDAISVAGFQNSYGSPKVVNIENSLTGLINLLKKNPKSLVIFPNWFDHNSVFKLMNSLSNEADLENVTMMGLPQWKEFPMVNFDLFEKFQVIIPESYYPDIENINVRRFAEKFFKNYGSSNFFEALYGFEITMLTSELLLKYGEDSFAKAKQSDLNKYSGKFSLVRTNKWSSPENVLDSYDFIENDKIFLTQFKEFRYRILEFQN